MNDPKNFNHHNVSLADLKQRYKELCEEEAREIERHPFGQVPAGLSMALGVLCAQIEELSQQQDQMSELIVTISEKYDSFAGEIYDTFEEMEQANDKLELHISATWVDFGVMLVEYFNECNMWTHVVAVREIKLLPDPEPPVEISREKFKSNKEIQADQMKKYQDALGFDRSFNVNE